MASDSRTGLVFGGSEPSPMPLGVPPELPRKAKAAAENLKRQRAAKRQEKYESRPSEANDFLRRQKVTEATQKKYREIANKFYLEERLKTSDPAAIIDKALNRRLLKK